MANRTLQEIIPIELKNGKLYVVKNLPEKPTLCDDFKLPGTCIDSPYCLCEMKQGAYEQSLLKAERVLIGNSETAFKKFGDDWILEVKDGKANISQTLIEGQIYFVQGSYEIEKHCIKGSYMESNECIEPNFCAAKPVAILTLGEERDISVTQSKKRCPVRGLYCELSECEGEKCRSEELFKNSIGMPSMIDKNQKEEEIDKSKFDALTGNSDLHEALNLVSWYLFKVDYNLIISQDKKIRVLELAVVMLSELKESYKVSPPVDSQEEQEKLWIEAEKLIRGWLFEYKAASAKARDKFIRDHLMKKFTLTRKP